jgi:hypothetical protein
VIRADGKAKITTGMNCDLEGRLPKVASALPREFEANLRYNE